jgi:hypothetical protein
MVQQIFFTTDDGKHGGRNAFGLWPIKVFKSGWFSLYFSGAIRFGQRIFQQISSEKNGQVIH